MFFVVVAITLKTVRSCPSDLAGIDATINAEQCSLKLSTSPGGCTHTTLWCCERDRTV